MIFLGHGGIIRRDVWEKVGGFPEVVSEDIAFSTKIAELGYRGYFAGDVISFEDFPETYPQLRKQQEKICEGRMRISSQIYNVLLEIRKRQMV